MTYAVHLATDAWHVQGADPYDGPWLARAPTARVTRLRDTLGLPASAGIVSSLPADGRAK